MSTYTTKSLGAICALAAAMAAASPAHAVKPAAAPAPAPCPPPATAPCPPPLKLDGRVIQKPIVPADKPVKVPAVNVPAKQ